MRFSGPGLGKYILSNMPKEKRRPWATYEVQEYYLRQPDKGEVVNDVSQLIVTRTVERPLEAPKMRFGVWQEMKYLGGSVVDLVLPWRWGR